MRQSQNSIRHIGIDLDNTIIFYDAAFWRYGRLLYDMPKDVPVQKLAIRTWFRSQPQGEAKWTALQGYVYTQGISAANIAPGVIEFIKEAQKRNIPVSIVSHKTMYPAVGSRIDMRQKAVDFLETQGVLEVLGSVSAIYFADSRTQKITTIRDIGCDVFIDDLPEVYSEKIFPVYIKKILLSGQKISQEGVSVCADWQEVYSVVFGSEQDMAHVSHICVRQLSGFLYARPLTPSLNCRVYEAICESGSYLVKRYNTYEGDKRNRLHTEYQALTFLKKCGERWVPAPVALDAANNIGIYEFLHGENLREKSVTNKQVDLLLSFVTRLRDYSKVPEAKDLSSASEASFSIKQYIKQVERRMKIFKNVQAASTLEGEFIQFVQQKLQPLWSEILVYVYEKCKERHIVIDAQFSKEDLLLSPSDFGFHNCLQTSDGLYFIDYEYFGWDDSVKLIADLLLHPAMKLTKTQKKFIRSTLLAKFTTTEVEQRFDMVYLMLSIKWICIMLNCFTRMHVGQESENMCSRQLRLAQLHLARTVVEFQKLVQGA